MLITAVKPGDTIKDIGGGSSPIEVNSVVRKSPYDPYVFINNKYRYDIGAHVQMVKAAKNEEDDMGLDITVGDVLERVDFDKVDKQYA